MLKPLLLASALAILLGAGCSPTNLSEPVSQNSSYAEADTAPPALPVVLPLDGLVAGYNPTYKRFGEYIADRFTGYHVGEDAEIVPEDLGPEEIQTVPVQAIADGVVRYADWVSGYGGVMVIAHTVMNETVNALYGHIDLGSTALKIGDAVIKGQFLAQLGADRSKDTDGERQHLHFALYGGDELRLSGYERDPKKLEQWINPQDFFAKYGVPVPYDDSPKAYSAMVDPDGQKIFKLDFALPPGWDVEYVPQIQALNLYDVHGSGTARERSQIFIRYFDADRFLTLPTVTVYSAEDQTVGEENYTARRYDILKQSQTPDFPHQPSWRNERHIVTDLRAGSGRTRYYVVAKNPTLGEAIYTDFLNSIRILE